MGLGYEQILVEKEIREKPKGTFGMLYEKLLTEKTEKKKLQA